MLRRRQGKSAAKFLESAYVRIDHGPGGECQELVVWFFMDLRHENPLTKLFALGGLFWLLLLIGLTMADYLTRSWMPVGSL